MDKGLGGIMFWELGNDTKEEGSLLDAIYKAATN
jgi:chitinase